MTWAVWARRATLAGAAALTSACTERPSPRRPAAGDTSHSTPAAAPRADVPPAPALGDPTGRWVVVGDSAPGISAMDAAEARRWHGREARYGPDSARFDTTRCARPAYQTDTVAADSLLDVGYRLRPGALGFAPGGRVTVTAVTCGGRAWTAPGALLLWADAGRAYTAWDGVFFVLARRP